MSRSDEIRVRVAAVSDVADRVKRFTLVPVDRDRLPTFSGGAHVTVLMDDGRRRIRNPYSLMSSPDRTDAYQISVLAVPDSRGGSAYLHDRVVEGSELLITPPGNLFPVHQLARRHLLVAGGIGITPFVAMAAQLDRLGHDFQLHYAMRSESSGAYGPELQQRYGDRVTLYRTGRGQRIPIDTLLADQPLGTHLYVCGPEKMIDAVLQAGRDAGWPDEALHAECFLGPPPGDPFTVRLARAGVDVRVGEHESILEAVEAAGLEPPYLCRGGACGQCETRVLDHDGVLEHHDHYLTDAERDAGRQLMICMSRFRGQALTLDL
ncbi:ferredoxin--NADP(+) reductase [Modestobacter sp. VKM Ac-2676]|nr:ferredoxin--NADP(+) reductase [Modestobacter sp. VKM Ac-2676]